MKFIAFASQQPAAWYISFLRKNNFIWQNCQKEKKLLIQEFWRQIWKFLFVWRGYKRIGFWLQVFPIHLSSRNFSGFWLQSRTLVACSLIEGAFTDLRWVREYTQFVPKLKSFFFSSILVHCNRWQFWGAGRKGKQSNSPKGMMSKWVPGRHGVLCFFSSIQQTHLVAAAAGRWRCKGFLCKNPEEICARLVDSLAPLLPVRLPNPNSLWNAKYMHLEKEIQQAAW
jgi:hypothetical protein